MGARCVAVALTVSILALAPIGRRDTVAAPPHCEASVHGELSHVERKELVTTHTFTVQVSTMETCARIHFTLFTTERISKTKTKVFKTPGEVRLHGGSVSRILNYDMPNERSMVRWEVKVTGCERCEP